MTNKHIIIFTLLTTMQSIYGDKAENNGFDINNPPKQDTVTDMQKIDPTADFDLNKVSGATVSESKMIAPPFYPGGRSQTLREIINTLSQQALKEVAQATKDADKITHMPGYYTQLFQMLLPDWKGIDIAIFAYKANSKKILALIKTTLLEKYKQYNMLFDHATVNTMSLEAELLNTADKYLSEKMQTFLYDEQSETDTIIRISDWSKLIKAQLLKGYSQNKTYINKLSVEERQDWAVSIIESMAYGNDDLLLPSLITDQP